MSKKLYGAVAIIAVMLFFGCITDGPETGNGAADPIDVTLKVPTRAGDDSHTVRIIIFKNGTGKMTHNMLFADDSSAFPEDTGLEYTLSLMPGVYDFFAIVNEKDYMTTEFVSLTNRDQLKNIRISNLVLSSGGDTYRTVQEDEVAPIPSSVLTSKVIVGYNGPTLPDGQNPPGQISTDNGLTWTNVLNLETERTVAKLRLALRKETQNPADYFIIRNIQLLNVPSYSYMIQKTYDGTYGNTMLVYDYQAPSPELPDPAHPEFEIRQNLPDLDENYVMLADNVVGPEFILLDNTAYESSMTLRVGGHYFFIPDGGSQYTYYDVWGIVPLGNDITPPDYDYNIYRNHYYNVFLTIKKATQYIFEPEVRYSVQGWDDAGGGGINIGGAITVGAKGWIGAIEYLNDDPTTHTLVIPSQGGYADYQFTLVAPMGAEWQAYLTDNENFEFDQSFGYTRRGAVTDVDRPTTHTIRIKAKDNPTNPSDRATTQFYILVNTSSISGFTEISLIPGDENTGKRYAINKVPSF